MWNHQLLYTKLTRYHKSTIAISKFLYMDLKFFPQKFEPYTTFSKNAWFHLHQPPAAPVSVLLLRMDPPRRRVMQETPIMGGQTTKKQELKGGDQSWKPVEPHSCVSGELWSGDALLIETSRLNPWNQLLSLGIGTVKTELKTSWRFCKMRVPQGSWWTETISRVEVQLRIDPHTREKGYRSTCLPLGNNGVGNQWFYRSTDCNGKD